MNLVGSSSCMMYCFSGIFNVLWKSADAMLILSFDIIKKIEVIFILNGFIWKILSPTYYSCIASMDDFMLLNTSLNILWHQSLCIQPLQDELQMPQEDPLEEKGGLWKNISSSTTRVCLNRHYRELRVRKLTRIIQTFYVSAEDMMY